MTDATIRSGIPPRAESDASPSKSFTTRLAARVAAVGCALACCGFAIADWPQWRGPERDGRSTSTGLARSWPAEGPPLLWTGTGLGTGFSNVSVAGGLVVTMGDADGRQSVVALDAAAGRSVWKTDVGVAWDGDDYAGPRSTPTIADGRVIVLTTEGVVVALDARDGAVLWRRDLVADYDARVMQAWGGYDFKFSESPLVDRGRVVVTPGSPDAWLVALDAKDGSELWRTPGRNLGERGVDGAGYASAVVSNAAGVRQYVQFLGRGVVGVDAKTGRFLWGYNRVANDIANVPTPVALGDRVFVSSGYGTGSALLEIVRKDGRIVARERYFLDARTFQNHHGGIVVHRGVAYAGTGHNLGNPVAIDLERGAIAWGPVRNAGERSASLTFADGLLMFRYENGLVVLVEASPQRYRERGSFRIPGVRRFSWPHPVVADGRMYLREQDRVLVYDVAEGIAGKTAAR